MADKVQRNTQAELLAVLTTILTWREELAGSCLLILGDSTSSETNLRKGTAGNQHSRDIVAQIHLLSTVYRIHIWYDWVPSKQNPGDPYSRPLTDAKLAKELDDRCSAQRVSPVLPLSINMRPVAWRNILGQDKKPELWPRALRFDLLTQLGLIQPCQLAEMVLSTVDENKAQCLLLGHWPMTAKGKGKASSASTAWFKHIVQAMQHVTDAVAPLEGIYSVVVQQRGPEAPTKLRARFTHKVCGIKIQNGKVQVARHTGEMDHRHAISVSNR